MQQVSSNNCAMIKLTDKVTALEHSIDFVSNQVTDREAEIADLRCENTNINSQLKEMKSRMDKIESTVENEADQLDQLEIMSHVFAWSFPEFQKSRTSPDTQPAVMLLSYSKLSAAKTTVPAWTKYIEKLAGELLLNSNRGSNVTKYTANGLRWTKYHL